MGNVYKQFKQFDTKPNICDCNLHGLTRITSTKAITENLRTLRYVFTSLILLKTDFMLNFIKIFTLCYITQYKFDQIQFKYFKELTLNSIQKYLFASIKRLNLLSKMFNNLPNMYMILCSEFV